MVGMMVALGGCVPNLPLPYQAQVALGRAEWHVRPINESWVNAPSSRLLLERQAAGLTEQKLMLPNHTSLRGENFIHLRAVSGSIRGRRFDLDHSMTYTGGIPFPFSAEDLTIMRARSDAAGTLVWAIWMDGAGLTCVLALRRLHVGARIIPDGATAIDLVMRNCLRGDVEDALLPAGPLTVAFPAPPGMTEGAPRRTLSPLAAPGL